MQESSPEAIPQLVLETVPAFYTDGMLMTGTGFTITLTFLAAPPGQPTAPTEPLTLSPVAIVRMSPEHAKVMAIVLKKNMKAFEQQGGVEIALSPAILTQFQINLAEDWQA